MTQVTFVKKKLENGDWCAKCNDVSARLEKDGTAGFIDRTVVADLADPKSEGIQLAEQYSMDRAPFFVVKDSETNSVEVFDVYFKFKRHMERFAKTA
ncbi:hypothetical protein [Leucothrix arctica]|uniref:Thioredoxin family protein n=1 Tax=Leucothrix arctica TaxID=1481894 RepID=A0A317CGI7_9GAMM|nr:hypothetical protein [Leucothrix arctica]PWQ95332.1 hypothetical protein DKT75_13415 [Leucothrix arctica]